MKTGSGGCWEAVSSVPTRREMFQYFGAGLLAKGLRQVDARLHGGIPPVFHALALTRQASVPSLAPGAIEDLGAVVDRHIRTVRRVDPTDVYDQLLGARAYAGSLLDSPSIANGYRDLTATVGLLSNLLALVTLDLGDHAAALIWCDDAERRSEDARMPELAGWAAYMKVCMSFYDGRVDEAVVHARKGQARTPVGTVAHAQLVVQEMRAWALAGRADAMQRARHRAEQAIARLPAGMPGQGVFSISLADDPPLTATSLLLLGRFREAEEVTRRTIATHYGPEGRNGPGDHPSGFARSHLVLALTLAGLRELEESHRAGVIALDSPRLVWPTAVLASKLDQVLMRDFPNTPLARDYHDRCVAALRQAPASRTPLT